MELDITKRDRQIEGASKWRNARGIGTFYWTPRFGKTYGAIEFIINPHLNVNVENCVIIIVPSEIIAQQWETTLRSFANDLTRIAFYTASYFSSNPDFSTECTLLIVDELQKFLTPERKSMIDGTRVKHHYRLGLTGTYPSVDWMKELYPIVDIITEDEAIEKKWISPFLEYNWLLELPETDKAKYERFSGPISETLEMFKPLLNVLVREGNTRIFNDEFSLIMACKNGFSAISLSGIKKWITYDQLCNTISLMLGWHIHLDLTVPANKELAMLWAPSMIHNRAKVFIDFVRKRNDVLIDNNVKLEAVAEIISRNTVPTIIFNESTAFADRLTEYLNARFNGTYTVACYHSQIDSKLMIDPTTGDYFKFSTGERAGLPKTLGKDSIKKIVIQGFRDGYYDALCTAKSLDEGLDIPKIEQVICTGGTTNPMTYQQRTARGKSVDYYNPDKITKIYNLVFDDFINSTAELIKSRDKTKLILRQSETGSTIKWLKNLDEINNVTSE